MTGLAERFATHLASLGLEPGPALVAVSGGPDSLALLHLLCEAGDGRPLIVAHVDHGIHPESGAVADAVRRKAEGLGLLFESAHLGLGGAAGETEARAARYRWLMTRARARGAMVFTAHHRDDQVETVLLRVLGGTGPAGLAGMAAVTGRLVRPLLPFGRDELGAWLAHRGVVAWQDPANVDETHLRSWLRVRVLPELRGRIPALDSRLVRLAGQARAGREAWDAVLDALPLEVKQESGRVALRGDVLAGLPEVLGVAVLQAVARRAGHVLGYRAAARALVLAVRGSSGRRADLGAGWMAELAFNQLVMTQAEAIEEWSAEVSGERGQLVRGGWRLAWDTGPAPARQGRAPMEAWLRPGGYQVRPWRPGDRIRPVGGTGRRLIVRMMQEAGIPRMDRASWPLLVQDAVVVWAPGVALAEGAEAPGGRAMHLVAERLGQRESG